MQRLAWLCLPCLAAGWVSRAPPMASTETVAIRFVSGNAKKVREASLILAEHSLPFSLRLEQAELDLDELQADSGEKVAAAKCRLAAKATGGPVLVDDTSLCFEALGGMPGAYIKWFQAAVGAEGLVRMLDGFEDKRAYAQSCLAFSPGPGAEPRVFVGRCHGRIVELSEDYATAPGDADPVTSSCAGFGWDAAFLPTDGVRVFAQMELAEKNALSHRAKALAQFSRYLREHEELYLELCASYRADPKPPRDNFSFRRRRTEL